MGRAKAAAFWIFHIIMKILPSATAFILGGSGVAESFSGNFYNIFLLAGYLFAAFAVISCYIDYRLIRTDREKAGSDGVKKILIIDGTVFLAAAVLFVYFVKQGAYINGISSLEFIKEFNFFYWLGLK